jgi:hypothetical protein
MAPGAFYDSGFVETSIFHPVVIALKILYNADIKYFDH